MDIAIHDHEDKKYPNLALMKLSAYHKAKGDNVEWFDKSKLYHLVYSSKVFTWTPVCKDLPMGTVTGGTGFHGGMTVKLRDEIEMICPDYSIYNCDRSYGFLTRGCIRQCKDCFVPEKEGAIKAHADIEDFARHDKVVLMDNNVLASDHGIKQIEKIIKLGLKVDFNQGLDARLIDNAMAKLLSQVKWHPEIRLACDSLAMIDPVRKAVDLLRWHNTSPPRYFCYVLSKDYESTKERVRALKGMYVDPFVQTLRNKENTFVPSQRCMDLKRFVNNRRIYRSCAFEDYKKSGGKRPNRHKA